MTFSGAGVSPLFGIFGRSDFCLEAWSDSRADGVLSVTTSG